VNPSTARRSSEAKPVAPREPVYEFVTQGQDAGQRIDLFLASHPQSPGWSRATVQRLIKNGLVHLNGQQVKTRTALRPGDRVVARVPAPHPILPLPEAIPLDIAYEDSHLVVLNKPPGLVVHPAAGHSSGTLVNALLHHCRDLAGIGGALRPGIVHRLDKDTSGLMVAAKTDASHQGLQKAMKARKIKRTYLAIARGTFSKTEGRIEGPIGRNPRHRKKMAVTPSGRPAATLYRVIEQFQGYSLVELRLETGRTHQIRVHLAHVGRPIVGDTRYASPKKTDPPIGRQALHACRLSFFHPITGRNLSLEAPLPEDMQKILEFLRKGKAT